MFVWSSRNLVFVFPTEFPFGNVDLIWRNAMKADPPHFSFIGPAWTFTMIRVSTYPLAVRSIVRIGQAF